MVEVVVVGAGVMGLAAAHTLAGEGREVVVLEQFHVGTNRASSHGSSRIFRLAYEEPEQVAMAQEALALWRELEARAGAELLTLTGSLDAGRDTTALRAALDSSGAEYEVVTRDDAAARFGVAFEDEQLLVQPQGGVAWAARTLEAFRDGVEVREGVRVVGLRPGATGVGLETSEGPVEAGAAIVAAGAWSRPLLRTAGIDLAAEPTRETVVFFAHEDSSRLPAVIDWDVREGVHAYALPAGDGLLKAGLHRSGRPADPDDSAGPDAEVVAYVSAWVGRTFPGASPVPVNAETCLYTNIESDRFVLERHGSVVVCSACSGHGFKFAPAVGKRVAALA